MIATLGLIAGLLALVLSQTGGHGLVGNGMVEADDVISRRGGGHLFGNFRLSKGNRAGNGEENMNDA